MLVLSSTLLARFSCCEDRIGLSRKVGSTTAYQAFLPINLAKREIYWTMDYPAGITDIERRDIIDVDEAGIFLKIANRKYGKVSVGSRVRMGGQYGHSLKYTMTIVISGSEHGERWMDFEQKAGTDIASFYDFIVPILDDIGPGTPQRGRYFTMDNLLAHKHPVVVQAILAAGHRVVYLVPYYLVDGPFEKVFNSIQQQLQHRMFEVVDGVALEQTVRDILGRMTDFINYFRNCGFTL